MNPMLHFQRTVERTATCRAHIPLLIMHFAAICGIVTSTYSSTTDLSNTDKPNRLSLASVTPIPTNTDATPQGATRGCMPAWIPGIGMPGFNQYVYALAVFDDGNGPALYAGGQFDFSGSTPVHYIAKWTGTSWITVGGGTNGPVYAMVSLDDGSGPALFVGGSFTSAGGTAVHNVARWDGRTWSPLGDSADIAVVHALTTFHDGSSDSSRLFAGGTFISGDTGSIRGVATWDGARWTVLQDGPNATVFALTVHDDGIEPALVAGGMFTQVGSLQIGRIAQWKKQTWSAVGGGAGTDGPVHAVHSWTNPANALPTLVIGGDFWSVDGVNAQNIAGWDGSQWSPFGQGLWNTVFSLADFDSADGAGRMLIAGGTFYNSGQVSLSGVAKWQDSAWASLGGGVGPTFSVEALLDAGTLFSDAPTLIAGGNFQTAGGWTANGIAAFEGCGGLPIISAHPDSILLGIGGGLATFSVAASGSRLEYQWLKDGQPLTDSLIISGANLPQLTVFSTGPSMVGLYACEVSSPDGPSVTSKDAVLGVRPSCSGDLTLDGVISMADLLLLLSNWGTCP